MGSPLSAAADHKWKKGKKRMLLFAVCLSPPPPPLFFSCRPSSSHDNPLFLFSANIAPPSSPGQWRDHISIPPPPPSTFHNRTPIAINPRRRQSVSPPLHLICCKRGKRYNGESQGEGRRKRGGPSPLFTVRGQSPRLGRPFTTCIFPVLPSTFCFLLLRFLSLSHDRRLPLP